MPAKIDYLKFAIGALGGVAEAAEKLEVSPATVRRWIKRGLGRVKCSRVAKLSELSGVELETLSRRLGPFQSN
jgi:hypothetical protein